jgi:hypothetical protein
MSKGDTSKVVRYSRDNLPPDQTDWARVAAMTDDETMAAALSDPDAPPLTPEHWPGTQRVSRVKVPRQRLGMTQAGSPTRSICPQNPMRLRGRCC